MIICNTIIQDKAIAGIGPLIQRNPGGYDTQMLYGNYQLYFQLHLKTGTITIESGIYSQRGYSDQQLKKDKTEAEAFRASYWQSRDKITALLFNTNNAVSESMAQAIDFAATYLPTCNPIAFYDGCYCIEQLQENIPGRNIPEFDHGGAYAIIAAIPAELKPEYDALRAKLIKYCNGPYKR